MNQIDMFYPHTPGHRGVDTSIAAAKAIQPMMGVMQTRVILELMKKGPMTNEELCKVTGIAKTSTMSARLRELELLGKIIRTDERRKSMAGINTIVWRVL